MLRYSGAKAWQGLKVTSYNYRAKESKRSPYLLIIKTESLRFLGRTCGPLRPHRFGWSLPLLKKKSDTNISRLKSHPSLSLSLILSFSEGHNQEDCQKEPHVGGALGETVLEGGCMEKY